MPNPPPLRFSLIAYTGQLVYDHEIVSLPSASTLAVLRGELAGRALDFAANRTTAMGAEVSKYRFVHFATHGFLNSRHPELSGIVLSLVDEQGSEQDGFLRAHEIYNLRLPAEMVVLSGCRTGLGKDIRGEGLVGLTRGFMCTQVRRACSSAYGT